MDWAQLERVVERVFAADGYATQRNARLRGRSGGLHEIDVFAEKQDAVTSVRIAVECKAWERAINKDVVAKAAWVRDDAGIHKTILVTSSGWTRGAEQAALDQGIELWGPAELEQHLRRIGAAPEQPPAAVRTSRIVHGWAPQLSEADAQPILTHLGDRNWRGKPRETLVWWQRLWVPAHRIRFSFRKQHKRLRTYSEDHLYTFDALRGGLVFTGGPEPYELELRDPLLPLRVDARSLTAEILKAADKYWHLKTESARERHAAVLRAKGIPLTLSGISVHDSSLVWLPYFAGVYNGSTGGQRVVALDAIGGRAVPAMGTTLTHCIDVLRQI